MRNDLAFPQLHLDLAPGRLAALLQVHLTTEPIRRLIVGPPTLTTLQHANWRICYAVLGLGQIYLITRRSCTACSGSKA